jgi:alkaline phosphatase D
LILEIGVQMIHKFILAAKLSLLSTVFVWVSSAVAADPTDEIIGPLIGHTDTTSSILWARFPKAGEYAIRVSGAGEPKIIRATALTENDLTVHWSVPGLKPATTYQVELKGGRPCSFKTPPADDQPTKTTIAFGSCAKEDSGSRAVWSRMAAENVDAVVLCGDTPYIDSTDLTEQRRRHREFAAVTEYQALLSTRPFWTTWDDHDFGKNDADGNLKGKENSRRAFTEYRSQLSYGDGAEGIYNSFRWGSIEVILLDTRWWSYTAASYADPQKQTLLGKAQWAWLKTKLKASTAPFKVIACGMIWDDKQNKEKDDWETYAHERTMLFDFIKTERIPGVMLFGGDIHVTRLLKYPATQVGYPLYQFISSPIHGRVIPSLDVPHPNLVQSKLQKHTFMTLTADRQTLIARFLDQDGNSVFPDTKIDVSDLSNPNHNMR